MKRNIFEIYSLSVCFISVLIFIVALGIGIYDIIEISFPEFTTSSYLYKEHSSNENYKQFNPQHEKLSNKEITMKREQSWNNVIDNERRDAFQSLLQVFIFIVISAVVFAIHWFYAKKIHFQKLSDTNE